MNSSLFQQYPGYGEERSRDSSQQPSRGSENHSLPSKIHQTTQGSSKFHSEGLQMEVDASSHPDSSSVVPRSSSRGVTAQEASNGLQQRGPSTEAMGAAVNMSQIKELSVGLTFRRTKRGFFIYVNDDNEKVFLDEHNRLHKLNDGYDAEEVEVVHLNSNPKVEDNALHADVRSAQEVDLAAAISSEVSRLKQLELQITQQQQMLDQQYSQYQEYRQRSQQYVQYPQYIQQIEQSYRPAEQQVTGNQRKLMDDIMQVVQQNAESPVNYTLLVEKYGSQNATPLCNILQQLVTKQRENYQYVCAKHAEGLLHRNEYPIYQGNMEQMHQQQIENQYREQQQVWSQLKQLIHDELSLLEQLHNVNSSHQQQVQQEDERLHSHQEEELKNFGENRQLQNQQRTQALPHPNQEHNQQQQQQPLQQLSAPPPPPPPHQQSQHLPPSSMTPPPHRQSVGQVSSNQTSQPPQQSSIPSHLSATTASSSVVTSSVKFSGHFDPQRRPLYSDGASNYYRYNTQRQLEKVPVEELASLHLS